MEIQLTNSSNSVTLAPEVFDCEYNEVLVHQVVVAHLAGARQGSKQNRSRSDVAGGGSKPWKQKGTGRARAGTIRSPLWRGGGVTFAARPRNHSQKVNRKMLRGAMVAALSELYRQQRIIAVETISIAEPKTRLLLEWLQKIETPQALIITVNPEENLLLAVRNLVGVAVADVQSLNTPLLLGAEKLVMTSDAIQALNEKYS